MSADAAHADGHHDDHGLAHTMPIPVLLGVYAALLFCTWLTVATSSAESPFSLGLELGWIEMFVALGIATIKATLVGAYFMHLRYDRPLNAVLLVFSLVFVGLFILLTVSDATAYRPQLEAAPQPVAAPAATEAPAASEAADAEGSEPAEAMAAE